MAGCFWDFVPFCTHNSFLCAVSGAFLSNEALLFFLFSDANILYTVSKTRCSQEKILQKSYFWSICHIEVCTANSLDDICRESLSFQLCTQGCISFTTLLVKCYNDLLDRQSSGRGRDEVTYFSVGYNFWIHLGTTYTQKTSQILKQMTSFLLRP